jgi:hypothetical protein
MATTLILDEAGIPRRQGGAIARVGQRTERIVLSTAFIVIVLVAWQVVTALGIEPPQVAWSCSMALHWRRSSA